MRSAMRRETMGNSPQDAGYNVSSTSKSQWDMFCKVHKGFDGGMRVPWEGGRWGACPETKCAG